MIHGEWTRSGYTMLLVLSVPGRDPSGVIGFLRNICKFTGVRDLKVGTHVKSSTPGTRSVM